MKAGQQLIRKFENGGSFDPLTDYDDPANFELYNYLSGLDPQQFAAAMQSNFGMVTPFQQDELGEDTTDLLDYSMLFQQYDPTAQTSLRDTYASAMGKSEGKARNTLEEAYRMSRGAPQTFGGVGSSLKEAFNRAFTTRDQAQDLAQQQFYGGTFDLQSDFTGAFEDQLANLSATGVEFDPSTVDQSGWNTMCPDGTYAATEAECPTV